MSKRPARLAIKYRPRINRVVVLHRGRVVFRGRAHEDADAFIRGWREEEARRLATAA